MYIFKMHDAVARLLSRKISPASVWVGDTWSYVYTEERES